MAKSKHTKDLVEGILDVISNNAGASRMAPRIQYALEQMSEQAREETSATVESSVELHTDEKQSIKTVLSDLVGHPVEVTYNINKDLVGGMRIKVGDWILDTSFEEQLNTMADMLLPKKT